MNGFNSLVLLMNLYFQSINSSVCTIFNLSEKYSARFVLFFV